MGRQDTLQAMISHRTNVLVFVRIFALPTTAGTGIKGTRTGIGRGANPRGPCDVTSHGLR